MYSSCSSLQTPSPKRAWNWKTFISKLQTKIRKLKKPNKTIKKPKHGLVFKSKSIKPSENKPSSYFLRRRRKKLCSKKIKCSSPVYMNKLLTVVPEPEASEELAFKACAADDMWESVEMASPLMRHIDKRADEFILRFRTGMARGL